MKKRIILAILSLSIAIMLGVAGVYAASTWLNQAENTDNTVKIGDAVTLTFDEISNDEVYFDEVSLIGPGSATTATTITVLNPNAYNYKLIVSELAIDGDPFNYTVDDLYIKVDANAAKKFEEGAILIPATTAASTEISVVIGLGADATIDLAGKTITFTIATVPA